MTERVVGAFFFENFFGQFFPIFTGELCFERHSSFIILYAHHDIVGFVIVSIEQISKKFWKSENLKIIEIENSDVYHLFRITIFDVLSLFVFSRRWMHGGGQVFR